MAEATEELDLSSVNDLLAHWWRMARMEATDEYDEVLEHALLECKRRSRVASTSKGRPLRGVLAERAAELGMKLDL